MPHFYRRLLLGVAFAICAHFSVAQTPKAPAPVWSVGIVPQFTPAEITQIWAPVLEELSLRSGITLNLQPSRTITAFEVSLESGEFDFAYANPYQALRASKKQGYLTMVRDQLPLSGVLVVQKNSPFIKVSDLAGQVIAFPAPNALGASLLVRADLDAVHRITFTPQYAASHSAAYASTLKGQTAATGGIEATFGLLNAEDKANLRVLYRTRETLSHPFMAHPQVPDAVRKKLQDTWLGLSADPAWNARLSKIPFDRLTKTQNEDYKFLDSMNLDKYYVAPPK
jgi:phosphonate transport system substrate-binding protein